MRPSAERDFDYQRRFIPAMKRIIAEHLLVEAPAEEDALRNSDLIVLGLPNQLRVACRVRKYEYLARYGDEFTLRASRGSGVQTELQKVLNGWGTHLLYGFAAPDESAELVQWVLGDLDVFRGWYWDECLARDFEPPGIRRLNQDGSSTFLAFRIGELPPEFVVARLVAPPEHLFALTS
jgi:hypothetical protein